MTATTDTDTGTGTDVLDAQAVEVLLRRAQHDVDDGVLPGCSLAFAHGGEVILEAAFGASDPDSRYHVFSSTKPFVASVIWQLMAEGLVDVHRPVAEYVPEFGTNGKDAITVEQVMLHTSGFPHAPLGPPAWATHEDRLAAFAKWKLNWDPGTSFEYHPTSAHWVLAAIIRAVTGDDHRDALQRRVTDPLGLPKVLGVGPEDGPVTTLELRGEPTDPKVMAAALGLESMPESEVTDAVLLQFSAPGVDEIGVPGGGGVMTPATLALFYQALLHDPADLWDPEVRTDATGTVRNALPDRYTGVPANRSLGLVLAAGDGKDALRGMGHTLATGTFGHNGAAGQLAWADPTSGVSFAYCTNGIDQDQLRQWKRGSSLQSKAGACILR